MNDWEKESDAPLPVLPADQNESASKDVGNKGKSILRNLLIGVGIAVVLMVLLLIFGVLEMSERPDPDHPGHMRGVLF